MMYAVGKSNKMAAVLGLVVGLPVVSAHIALWDPSMYGWDPNDPNQYYPVYPFQQATFNEWWFHGYINQPPASGVFMELPAGGTYHGQVACNKALTSFSQPWTSLQNEQYACTGTGAMHTADEFASPNPTDVKGCGIAIAYQSDVNQVKPEDFTVITVNYTCPWFKNVEFPIPADLPACPPGGCHCMWGWVHSDDYGSEQIYFNGFRCQVTGATNTVPIPQAVVANKCPVDKSNCTVGPKQPHYWLQAEGNNNFQGQYDPPFYNGDYGFQNGAQTDLYANVNLATATPPAATSSSALPPPPTSTTAPQTVQTTSAAPPPPPTPSSFSAPAPPPDSSSTYVPPPPPPASSVSTPPAPPSISASPPRVIASSTEESSPEYVLTTVLSAGVPISTITVANAAAFNGTVTSHCMRRRDGKVRVVKRRNDRRRTVKRNPERLGTTHVVARGDPWRST